MKRCALLLFGETPSRLDRTKCCDLAHQSLGYKVDIYLSTTLNSKKAQAEMINEFGPTLYSFISDVGEAAQNNMLFNVIGLCLSSGVDYDLVTISSLKSQFRFAVCDIKPDRFNLIAHPQEPQLIRDDFHLFPFSKLRQFYQLVGRHLRRSLTLVKDEIELISGSMPVNYLAPVVTTYSKYVQSRWIGRLGTRMFQYALGMTYARRFGVPFYIPSKWEGDILFQPPAEPAEVIRDEILCHGFHRYANNRENCIADRKELVSQYNARTGDCLKPVTFENKKSFGETNVCSIGVDESIYSPWILRTYSSCELRSLFRLSDRVRALPLYKYWYDRRGTYDAAHVRRGGGTSEETGDFPVISIASYKKAIMSAGLKVSDVIWLSDDPNIRTPTDWDKYMKGGWVYPSGQEEVPEIIYEFLPDFLAMVFARTLFRGNSSLSFWAGFLGEGRVLSPVLRSGVDYMETRFMDCEFVEGNHPHFKVEHVGRPDIVFGP